MRGDAERARQLVVRDGQTFAAQAGIDLVDEPGALFQLLVVCQLLSARIRADVAIASARELFAAGWTTPASMRASSWQGRVNALGRGGYRRYDVGTSTRLGRNVATLGEELGDDLRRLRDQAGGHRRGPAALRRHRADGGGDLPA